MLTPQNKARFEKLKTLSPLAAIQAWLEGEFGIGDEPALCFAIRKDARIKLSDDDIADTIIDAMDEELTAQECLDRLTKV
jgi:hypothetical protein